MTTRDILIQLIGFCGTMLYYLSFQCRENKRLFRMQMFSYVFYTLHMLLLGAVTGGISYIISCLRSFCLSSRSEFAKSRGMCAILCFLQLAVLYFTWDGWISLLPVVASIASTLGGYTRNPKKVRMAGLFVNSPLCIVYDLIVGSWAGVFDECLCVGSMIVSVIRYGWNGLDRVEE